MITKLYLRQILTLADLCGCSVSNPLGRSKETRNRGGQINSLDPPDKQTCVCESTTKKSRGEKKRKEKKHIDFIYSLLFKTNALHCGATHLDD